MPKQHHPNPIAQQVMTRRQIIANHRKQQIYKIGALVLVMCLLMAICTSALAQTRPTATVSPEQPLLLIVDGKAIEADSLELRRGQQVMVWLRDLEKLGWGKAATGTAPGEFLFRGNNNITLSFIKGQGVAKVNALAVDLSVDSYMKNGKLMVPLSFAAKSLGYTFDLSYKAVATISTQPVKVNVEKTNSISGIVTYADKGVQGVFVCAVKKVGNNYAAVKNSTTRTAVDGSFKITGLPDGAWNAYIYIGNNPFYLSRVSEPVTVSNGQTARIEPIILCRIITSLSPQIDQKVIPSNGKIDIRWAPCPNAVSYKLRVRQLGSKEDGMVIDCKTSNKQILASKLYPGVKYVIKVSALDASGNELGVTAGSSGKPWVFSVAPKTNGR
ncbi:MAG: stalk domain-containing protein [Armatimonadetes bacterium]|nr:stalk domain-containing protein [Armatimonadota bacterium]